MKKLIFTFCLLSASALAFNLNAQHCATPDGSAACSPTGGPQSGGFEAASTTPCAVQGQAYSHAIQFTMFSAFDFQGQQSVDSIEFVSIENLPCGLCWAVNQADKRYDANEDGCVSISGTTTDAAGQYKLALSLKAWINGQATGLTIPASLVDQTGIRLLLRVKASDAACVNADTSASANNLTATQGGCPNGINDVDAGVKSFSIVPNPMNNGAEISFVAEKSALYTVRVTDVTGKEISSVQVDAKAGENTTRIERNNLPAGVYFLSLTNGASVVTKRFSIAD
ncbi:MAG TPA: T9SS type A sorting domain-containing protein [Chitinophagales bacterium]|nr:T9SS type A sorting domain-containing protein [Chitinophagales bacterium]